MRKQLPSVRVDTTANWAWSPRSVTWRPAEAPSVQPSSAMARDVKSKLSKNVLRMKFMQRGLDSETKKQLEEEEKKIISEEHWFLDLPELKEKESFIIEERSFRPCEDFLYGRMSFKGFNPEVEKLMIQMNSRYKAEETEEEDNAMEADVSDEEMARRYETLVGTIGKKFLKKRDRRALQDPEADQTSNGKASKVQKMFLKPQD
ncbi:M-phase phosphoprotein 6 [Hemicordylus capensis]|uniref:M-phase phosphoprotein 6 n=1 Tax=Hemicordylus capensis TaxID=884348 RepID=UPI00230448DB|nr:M-phase phosphoprotein 6 [Hemicordylus capensis]